MTTLLLPAETISTTEKTKYTVIWLHGLGADGNDFVPIVPELKLPKTTGVKFIFPHAPVRPVTLNNGMQMRAWFDMTSLDKADNTKIEDIMTTVGWINQIIEEEIKTGIPAKNILLAGFSQGGVIALFAGLLYPERLAGIMALSTYLPFDEKLLQKVTSNKQGLAVFTAHGINDPVIPLAGWESYVPKLEAKGFNVEAHSYAMEHSVCAEEVNDISKWLLQVL